MGFWSFWSRIFGSGAAPAPEERHPGVSELNQAISEALEQSLGEQTITGEITSLKKKPGIWYLTLSDDGGMISCVVPRRVFAALEPPRKSRFPDSGLPGASDSESGDEDGETAGADNSAAAEIPPEIAVGSQVLVTGRVRYYGPGGSLQLELSEIRAEGPGERHLRFLELKERLREQGYFDETAKRPLPEHLENVGIATAADGAVIHDIEATVKNSGIPFALRLYPTQVQGRGARDAIVRSLDYINREGICDVIILARGGGSLESLAVFSSEEVVKAVFASGIPVIAAIGHEINSSLADEAADYSVATPTAAAELLIREVRERETREERKARRWLYARIILAAAGIIAVLALFWFLRSR
ncbi:exodeoxyribonuclease VII large subunit [Succinimonas sp.]|uniref:exodeoxyribonuclease VII large subunit n=1 Tax=Succinimonas sp. TaxID=1936151 RepID=UPI0038681889